jgi:hypothetical protein
MRRYRHSPVVNVSVRDQKIQKSILFVLGKTRYTSWSLSSEISALLASADDAMTVEFPLSETRIFHSPEEFSHHIEYFQDVIAD